MKRLLLDTGDLCIGCMGRNKKYTTGVDIDSECAFNRSRWTGENRVGELLMLIREKLKKGSLEELVGNRK